MTDLGRPPELFGIAKLPAAKRRDELVRQIDDAQTATTRFDQELANREVVNVTSFWSRHDRPKTRAVVVHGITDPLDGNGKEALLVSDADDPDVRWLTIGIHMVASVDPITS